MDWMDPLLSTGKIFISKDIKPSDWQYYLKNVIYLL